MTIARGLIVFQESKNVRESGADAEANAKDEAPPDVAADESLLLNSK
jgi:hypothetical protein